MLWSRTPEGRNVLKIQDYWVLPGLAPKRHEPESPSLPRPVAAAGSASAGTQEQWDSQVVILLHEAPTPPEQTHHLIIQDLSPELALKPVWDFKGPETGLLCFLKFPYRDYNSVEQVMIKCPLGARTLPACGDIRVSGGTPAEEITVLEGKAGQTSLHFKKTLLVHIRDRSLREGRFSNPFSIK